MIKVNNGIAITKPAAFPRKIMTTDECRWCDDCKVDSIGHHGCVVIHPGWC